MSETPDIFPAGSFRKFLIGLSIRVVPTLLLIGALSGWNHAKHWINYKEVRVRVEKAEQLCKIVDRYSINGREEKYSSACPKPLDPSYFDKSLYPFTTIVSGTFVTFHYRSPADDKIYVGQVHRERNDNGEYFVIGDEIAVYASRYYPDEVDN